MKRIQVPFVILIIAFYMSVIGYLSFSKEIFQGANHILVITLSFFLGNTLFLLIYRGLGYVMNNARMALAGTFVISIFILFFWRNRIVEFLRCFESWDMLKIAAAVLVFILTGVIYFCIFNDYTEESFSVWTCLGTPHTARTTNIAVYIYQNNRIPILGQSYAQALFISIIELLGIHYSYIALYIYSVFCVTCSFFFWIGILQSVFHITFWIAILATLLIFLGGECLSTKRLLLQDSASGAISQFAVYPDIAISSCLFVQFVFWGLRYIHQEIAFRGIMIFLVIAAFAWVSAGIQFTVLSFGLMIVALLISVIQGNEVTGWMGLVLIFTLATVLFSQMGGMLVSKKKITAGLNGQMEVGKLYRLNGLAISKEGINKLAVKWLEIISIIYIPILINITFIIMMLLQQIRNRYVIEIGFIGIMLFIGGYTIVYPFAISGKKMESNRFLSPAFAFARITAFLIMWEVGSRFEKYDLILPGILIFLILLLGKQNAIRIIHAIEFRVKNYKIENTLRALARRSEYIYAYNKFCGKSRDEILIRQAVQVGISDLLESNNLSVVLYGASATGHSLLEMLTHMNIKVICFADGDRQKWGTMFCEKRVVSPNEITEYMDGDCWIMIASNKVVPIYKNLNTIGCQNIKWFNLYK